MREKDRANIKRALVLKRRLATILHDARLQECGRFKTLICKNCNAISVSKQYLKFYLCGRRYCPICQRISSSSRARLVTESVVTLMQQYEAKGTAIIPTIITLTIPHKKGDSLKSLLKILTTAFKWLRQGGTDKEKVRLYRQKQTCFWRQYFVGEVYSIEIPYNENSGWHPHVHALALRFENKKIPLGIHRWTGAITNPEEEGIRSLWHKFLKMAWNQCWENGIIDRPYILNLVELSHIKQAKNNIRKALFHKFPELFEDCQLTYQEKVLKLSSIKDAEIQKLENETENLLGREIAAFVDIKALFYFDKQTNIRIPITWFLKQQKLLKEIALSSSTS